MNPSTNRTLACLALVGLTGFQTACTSTPEKTLTAPAPAPTSNQAGSPEQNNAPALPAAPPVAPSAPASVVPNDPGVSLPTVSAVCSGEDQDPASSVISWLTGANQKRSPSFRWVSAKPLDVSIPRAKSAALPLKPGQAMGVILLNCGGQGAVSQKYLYWFMPENQSAEMQQWLMSIKSAQSVGALPLQIFPALRQGWEVSAEFPKLVSEVIAEKNTAEQGSRVYFLPGPNRKIKSMGVESLQTLVPSLRFFELPQTMAVSKSSALKGYSDSYLYGSVPISTPLGIKRLIELAKPRNSLLQGRIYTARLCGYRAVEEKIKDSDCGDAQELKKLQSLSGVSSVLSNGVDADQYDVNASTLVDSRSYIFGWISIKSILESKREDQHQEWTEKLQASPDHIAFLLKGANIDPKISELVAASNLSVIWQLKSRMKRQSAGFDEFKVKFSFQ